METNRRSTKIFNDPVYGFVEVPYGTIFEIIEHPYFQRLRRIKQVSLTHYVYPGALHTRFHHALGAFHLMQQALAVLERKGVEITPEEWEAAGAAILMHDIGHGPFSHTLERTLINVHHEAISLAIMQRLNRELGGRLSLAIKIFKGDYHKPFLHQLISSQLDVDRLDYLTRDSFFTGVHEGVIGYDRLIKMLNVVRGQLVVEEKGIYSVEKFLIARRLMYWQVYLHKTVLSAEQMMIKTMERARQMALAGADFPISKNLRYFLYQSSESPNFEVQNDEILAHFTKLDDHDISMAIKVFAYEAEDPILSYLAQSLMERRLFKLELKNEPFQPDYVRFRQSHALEQLALDEVDIDYIVFQGVESNAAYSTAKDEINILFKDGSVRPASVSTDHGIPSMITTKYYLAYPKHLA